MRRTSRGLVAPHGGHGPEYGTSSVARRIVFPAGAGCVQPPSALDPLRRLGEVDFYDGPPPDRAQLIERLRPAEAVVLDYSEMDADVLRACERLRVISFL